MANSNYTGANITQGLGEGAAQVMSFPNTNRFIGMLYQQQQQRERRNYYEYQQTQNQLSKELANVRSADVPELRRLYDTQKRLHQQLLFDPKLQKDRAAYSQVEKQYNEAQSAFVQGVRVSTETLNFDKSLNEDAIKNWENYKDNARVKLNEAANMPTSQRIKLGYNSLENYIGNGGNYDWQKALKDAAGEKTTFFGKEQLSPDKTTYQTQTYTGYNNPAQFQQSLLGDLATKKAQKSGAYEYSKLTPEQIGEVNKTYDAMPQSEFDKWGIKKPNLDAPEDADNATKYVSYLSKHHAIHAVPTKGEVKRRVNEISEREFKLKTLATEQANKIKLANLNDALIKGRQAGTQQDVNSTIDALVEGQIEYAKDFVNKSFYNKDRVLPVDPATLQALGVDRLVLSEDGTEITSEWTDNQGVVHQNPAMRIEDYKAALGKRNIGSKYFQSQRPPEIKPIEKPEPSNKKKTKPPLSSFIIQQ